MAHSIAIIAPGRMGTALGGVCLKAGYDVVTLTEGRSAASIARAQAAGLRPVAPAELRTCELILLVVPPDEALSCARNLCQALDGAKTKPIVVDLNAISPQTAREVSALFEAAGCRFADGCIIGTAPAPDYAGPYLYFSGEAASDAQHLLSGSGLSLRVIDGPVGAASGFKMCFAGIMKGLTSLGILMLQAADKSGAGGILASQLAESQPELWRWFQRQIPASAIKHGRWVGEMKEISAFLTSLGETAGAAQFDAHAAGFSELAATGQLSRLTQYLEGNSHD